MASRGAIWQSGAGLAADNDGNIYFLDGNGTFDTTLDSNGFPINGDYGNAMMKVSTSGGLAVADYFSTYNTVQQTAIDIDLGSGGALVLPDISGTASKLRLVVGAGKDGNIYVANRDNMGKWNPNNNNNLYQQVTGALPTVNSRCRHTSTTRFTSAESAITSRRFPSSTAGSPPLLAARRADLQLSRGDAQRLGESLSQNGILVGVENTGDRVLGRGVARLQRTRPVAGAVQQRSAGHRATSSAPAIKFITPTIANGRVYVGTPTGVAVFGLLQ